MVCKSAGVANSAQDADFQAPPTYNESNLLLHLNVHDLRSLPFGGPTTPSRH